MASSTFPRSISDQPRLCRALDVLRVDPHGHVNMRGAWFGIPPHGQDDLRVVLGEGIDRIDPQIPTTPAQGIVGPAFPLHHPSEVRRAGALDRTRSSRALDGPSDGCPGDPETLSEMIRARPVATFPLILMRGRCWGRLGTGSRPRDSGSGTILLLVKEGRPIPRRWAPLLHSIWRSAGVLTGVWNRSHAIKPGPIARDHCQGRQRPSKNPRADRVGVVAYTRNTSSPNRGASRSPRPPDPATETHVDRRARRGNSQRNSFKKNNLASIFPAH